VQESIGADWTRGRFVRGGSTITQQLAKNLYLSPSKNPLRKLRELIIARRLEAELKKARILELYLNVIEWGDGVYGVEGASRTYFHAPASALGPSEAALLAAAIVNPRVLNPARPSARLIRRQQLILRRMGAVVPPQESAQLER
jgi:monofunctional biosynthetic peptidoglycan transglycosylase